MNWDRLMETSASKQEKQAKIDSLRSYADMKIAEGEALEREYLGCRPGWVSTDITMAYEAARRASDEAKQLELEIA